MTHEELEATAGKLQTDVGMLTSTFEKFIKHHQEEDSRREERQDAQAVESAAQYQQAQTFFKKHGGKLVGIIATVVAAFLAWYGNAILASYKHQEREKQIDVQIEKNASEIVSFKDESKEEFESIKGGMVKNRMLTVESVNHIEKTIMAAHPKLNEDEIPERPDSLKVATEKSEEEKIRKELFEK